MNTLKKAVDIEIYDGAGHAFENPANKNAYRPEAAADAWLRTLKFFDKAKGAKASVS
jgi:carboxymethylenebutenolidase